MLFAMQDTGQDWSKILTALLAVLGFILSCYNLVRLLRKDKEDRRNQQWQARTDFNERRQEATVLIMGVQLSVERNDEWRFGEFGWIGIGQRIRIEQRKRIGFRRIRWVRWIGRVDHDQPAADDHAAAGSDAHLQRPHELQRRLVPW